MLKRQEKPVGANEDENSERRECIYKYIYIYIVIVVFTNDWTEISSRWRRQKA